MKESASTLRKINIVGNKFFLIKTFLMNLKLKKKIGCLYLGEVQITQEKI